MPRVVARRDQSQSENADKWLSGKSFRVGFDRLAGANRPNTGGIEARRPNSTERSDPACAPDLGDSWFQLTLELQFRTRAESGTQGLEHAGPEPQDLRRWSGHLINETVSKVQLGPPEVGILPCLGASQGRVR